MKIRLLLASLSLGLLCGCLSRPSLSVQSFSFAAPPVTGTSPTNAPVLQIRRLQVASPYDSQSFTYRTGEFSYERDPYAQFLVPPAESFTAALRAYLRQSGIFSAVVEPGTGLKPDSLVDVTVDQLYGDFRSQATPAAVLAMHFTFFTASHGLPGRVILQKEYTRRVPLKARTARAVMAAWNEGLEQIMAEVNSDLKKALPPSG